MVEGELCFLTEVKVKLQEQPMFSGTKIHIFESACQNKNETAGIKLELDQYLSWTTKD